MDSSIKLMYHIFFFSVPTLPPTNFISIDIPLPGNIAYGLALKITDNNYVFTTKVMVWP